ncbi:myogenesis-regulating glycosidase [Chelonus insularis]|uniref:myogenesis-regulating glycosidase n=1 Tax=Chelonus insularis TaxID=460826 RepID=UPI00158E87FD|nr:myogenesis-regulating glycosidase [Chelonus insularis]XP_034948984.1 myogenesis-regulating glycosidase [Chelonus insularis]
MKKLVIINCIIFGLINYSLANENEFLQNSTTNRIKVSTKNAAFEVVAINNKLILNSTKNDGSKMHIEFFVEEPSLSNKPLTMSQCARNLVCIASGNITHTVIQSIPTREYVSISRFLPTSKGRLIDCLSLHDDTQWIGGPQYRYQRWPVQHMYYEEEPYVTTHPTNIAIAERYWLSSRGFSVYVYNWAPLFLDQNNFKDKHLCLIAENKKPYSDNTSLALSYEVAWHNDSKLAHESIVSRHLGKPNGIPDERMVRHPIWSTWARYKANITESIVNKFASEIVANKFNNSQLEIDDNWETCYGSAIFDPKKFPNVTRLTQGLKRQGFRITLWIHPFINEGCEPAYSTALKNGYFVKNQQGQVHTTWWQGEKGAGVIDFTNPNATNWWVARLKAIEKLGVDSFKFDAGESSWLPQIPILTGPKELQPGIYTRAYVNALATNFNNIIEARVGWGTQDLPIFIRMIDKDTRWTWNNGLPTLITTLLQMNMAGYVYVLPDMIGGNGYLNGFLNGTYLPSKELYIRWLQANVFMPSLQYSFTPWDFDKETVTICKKFTDLHASYASDIVKLMNISATTGAPLNPPIWWIDPTNQEAHKINDEYLLGTNILVAPVIEENSVARPVYLPKGMWKDGNSNRTYTGPMWIENYPAPLNILPYFIKLR